MARYGQRGARILYPNEPRGEFTLVVAGKIKSEKQRWTEDKVKIAIKFGLKLGKSPSVLAKRVAEESGWERQITKWQPILN